MKYHLNPIWVYSGFQLDAIQTQPHPVLCPDGYATLTDTPLLIKERGRG